MDVTVAVSVLLGKVIILSGLNRELSDIGHIKFLNHHNSGHEHMLTDERALLVATMCVCVCIHPCIHAYMCMCVCVC